MAESLILSDKIKKIISSMRDGQRIYKYTGCSPSLIILEKTEQKIPERIYYKLWDLKLLAVDDASSFETWLTLTELGKSIEL